MSELSAILAIVLGTLTAIPGLLPPASVALVTWSRVVSGTGWLGYAAAALSTGVPDDLLLGITVAQIGYGLAVLAIARQPCGDR